MENIFNTLDEISQKLFELGNAYDSMNLVVPVRMIAKTLRHMSHEIDDLNELLEYYVDKEA